MMINILIALIGSGFLSVLYSSVRFQKILSFLGSLVFAGIICWVYHNWQLDKTDSYSYAWLSSRYYPVNIEFFTNSEIYKLVTFFLTVGFLNGIYMVWDNTERQKTYVWALSSLNLAALMMLICGQNAIQILVSACFIDILGFCLISNMPARKRYIFYNLFADMLLFTSCAILWGGCHTNEITKIGVCLYDKYDFALYLILLSACIKTGLFPFQGYLLSMSDLSESRRNVMSFLSTPVVGFLIIYKFYPLFNTNFDGGEILKYIAYISILWGAVCGLVIKKLEKKKLYLNLVLYGVSFVFLLNKGVAVVPFLGFLLLLHLNLNNSMNATRKYYGMTVLFSILQICALISVVASQPQNWLGFIYLMMVLLITGSMILELSDVDREENHFIKILTASAFAATILNVERNISAEFFCWTVIYLILIVLRPSRLLRPLYSSEKIQQSDVFSTLLYAICAWPVLFLGRILWLTIDFLIIEKTFLSSLSKGNNVLQRIFGKINGWTIGSILLFTFIGLAIILYSSYGGR